MLNRVIFPYHDFHLGHCDRVTHICISKLTIIGSDNSMSPGRRQTIIWTEAWMLLIWPLETNFGEIWLEIHTFSFKKMNVNMSSAKWRPFCLDLNVIKPHAPCVNLNCVTAKATIVLVILVSDCQWHWINKLLWVHSINYNDVIISVMASQITSLTIVCSTVYSGAYQRKYQNHSSLAFVRGIHRWPVNSPHKGPVTRQMFPFDDVIIVRCHCTPLASRSSVRHVPSSHEVSTPLHSRQKTQGIDFKFCRCFCDGTHQAWLIFVMLWWIWTILRPFISQTVLVVVVVVVFYWPLGSKQISRSIYIHIRYIYVLVNTSCDLTQLGNLRRGQAFNAAW